MPEGKRVKPVRKIVVCLLVIAVPVLLTFWTRQKSTETPLDDLPPTVTRSEYDAAAKQFQREYGYPATRIDTISWLAEKYKKAGRHKQAAACFLLIPTSHPRYGRAARHQSGQVLLRLKKAAAAERHLREFIDLETRDPRAPLENLVDAKQRLRHLLEVQLRFEERRSLLASMVRSGQGDAFDAMFYCFPSLLRWNGPQTIVWLEEFLKEDPDNLKLRIALGRYRTSQGKLDKARRILERCRRDAPQNLFAIAAYLSYLREIGDWNSIAKELATLPPAKAGDPWLLLRIRGQSFNRERKFHKAVRCFRFELQDNPADAESCLGLAKAFGGLNQPRERKRMLEKAQTLGRIQNRLGWGQTSPNDVAPFIEIATQCKQIELYEQALIISRLAIRFDPHNEKVRKLIVRLKARQK